MSIEPHITEADPKEIQTWLDCVASFMSKEAHIIINGTTLSLGQSMTLRIAVTAFLVDMQENGLGGDAEGIAVAKINESNCSEIIRLISDRRRD
jgi:hypothetical protein